MEENGYIISLLSVILIIIIIPSTHQQNNV